MEKAEIKDGANKLKRFDAIVIGIGHAGVEAAAALSRKGHRTLALSISLDNAGFLACNPSIGGTAKGHLVRETDALGGVMGRAADKCLTHLRMLNSSKGPAVHSLRAQIDKFRYHAHIKSILENTKNLSLKQAEVKEVIIDGGVFKGVETVTGLIYYADVCVIAAGVYMESTIITGSVIEKKGPASFQRSNYLAQSLKENGFILRRFKTGTPARIKKSTVNFEPLERQSGEETPYSFSFFSNQKSVKKTRDDCFLGYTNPKTHEIISQNLHLTPKYGGVSHGTGARYCPSVEDKIVRFKDKPRHQFFLEPEGDNTQEMYVQGLSTGLPPEIQEEMYSSIEGFENIEIMRDAYAIEYECIDPKQLFPTLMSKSVGGLFFAGQINGTSGYEEAAAQGIVAGINAALFLEKNDMLIFSRSNSYIGVMIDDLVTKGADEPYRMMTSRAEYRLLLRQDNAIERLIETGVKAGTVTKSDYNRYKKYKAELEKAKEVLNIIISEKALKKYFERIGEAEPKGAMSVRDTIKRVGVTLEAFMEEFDFFKDFSPLCVYEIFIETKYEGYLSRERRAAEESKRIDASEIPLGVDFMNMDGLRIEAREKLTKVRPLTIGQAARISGVTPADINVLILRCGQLRGDRF